MKDETIIIFDTVWTSILAGDPHLSTSQQVSKWVETQIVSDRDMPNSLLIADIINGSVLFYVFDMDTDTLVPLPNVLLEYADELLDAHNRGDR